MLISSGQAKCVRCSGDILEDFFDLASIGNGMTPIVKVTPIFSNDDEKQVYEAIESGNNTVDTLLSATEKEMTDLLTAVAMLEIAGHVRMDEMGRYRVS